MELCEACSGISIRNLQSPGGYRHLENVWDLPASAKSCTCCALLAGALLKTGAGSTPGTSFHPDFNAALKDRGILQRVPVPLWIEQDGQNMVVTSGEGARPSRHYLGSLWLFSKDDFALQESGLGRLFTGRVLTSEFDWEHALTVINQWLQECPKDHSAAFGCHGLLSDDLDWPGLPERVIDVGLGTDSACLRLVEGNGIRGDYITLSHCWGKVRPLITTKQNLSAHLRGIAFDMLPLTFQHAVALTRRLKIQYLWIDSLCIIQDDPDDWLKESKKMASVYENSYFTIAASSATDSSVGFLSDKRNIGPLLRLCNENEGIEFFIHNYGDFHRDAEQSVLNSRAWVLQERLLSVRTIHFTSGQMYWECGLHVLSEAGQMFFSKAAGFRVVVQKPDPWYSMVNDYTACNLTEEKDKLIALAGVATKYQERRNQQYYAGMWLDDLHNGLLWLNRHKPLSRPKRYRAPSWSWASRDGPIQHCLPLASSKRGGEPFIESYRIRNDDARTGNLIEYLKLEICVSLRKAEGFGSYLSVSEFELDRKGTMLKWNLNYPVRCQKILELEARQEIGWAAFDDEVPVVNAEIWCARIRRGIADGGLSNKFCNVLLLRKTDYEATAGLVEYERVGLGVIEPVDWFDQSPAALISVI